MAFSITDLFVSSSKLAKEKAKAQAYVRDDQRQQAAFAARAAAEAAELKRRQGVVRSAVTTVNTEAAQVAAGLQSLEGVLASPLLGDELIVQTGAQLDEWVAALEVVRSGVREIDWGSPDPELLAAYMTELPAAITTLRQVRQAAASAQVRLQAEIVRRQADQRRLKVLAPLASAAVKAEAVLSYDDLVAQELQALEQARARLRDLQGG
jgi:hypothetical protein